MCLHPLNFTRETSCLSGSVELVRRLTHHVEHDFDGACELRARCVEIGFFHAAETTPPKAPRLPLVQRGRVPRPKRFL
eukprot:345749-Prorocentrum_minimum.AAC.1